MLRLDKIANETARNYDFESDNKKCVLEVLFKNGSPRERIRFFEITKKDGTVTRCELYIGANTPIFKNNTLSGVAERVATYPYRIYKKDGSAKEEQFFFANVDKAIEFVNTLSDGAEYPDDENIVVTIDSDGTTLYNPTEKSEKVESVAV